MTVLVPMTVEQDEDGWWAAHRAIGPDKTSDSSRPDSERHPIQSQRRPEPLPQPRHFDSRFAHLVVPKPVDAVSKVVVRHRRCQRLTPR